MTGQRTPLAALACVLALAAAPVQAADSSLLIRNVTVIDGSDRAPMPNANVLVIGDRIDTVSAASLDAPDGATVIDGSGKFLIPGLIDTHIHLDGGRKGMVTEGRRELTMDTEAGLEALHGYLYSGVTSVYDSANYDRFIFKLRDDERAGRIVSPRIFATGGVIAYPGGYASGAGSNVVGGMDDIAVLDAALAQQPDIVKFVMDPQGNGANPLRPTFPPDVLKQLVQYTQERGFRTTIHVASEDMARIAVDAGVNNLAHVMVRGRINDSFATYMATKQIPMSTTMVVYANIARVADDPAFFDDPLYVDTLPEDERDRQKTRERQRYISSGMSGFFGVLMPYMKENIAKFHEAGAILALGTDRTMGPTVHQELALIVEAGVPPADAIRIATRNAAMYLGKHDELGMIVPGMLADMVLLNADPTVEIANSRQIAAVFKGGEQIDRGKLKIPVND